MDNSAYMTNPDSEYVKRYLEGSEEALEFLISKYINPLYRFAYAYTKDVSEAEDVVQETFIKAWKKIGTFRQDMQFSTWIFSIAKNSIIDRGRKKKEIPFSVFEKETGVHAEELFSVPFSVEHMQTISLDHVSERQRQILSLKSKGYTFKEIASLLHIPLNTAKSVYRRTYISLRKKIGD